MHVVLFALVLVACCSCVPLLAQELPRRGDFGASLAPPADGKPPRLVRFRPGSVLQAAGAEAGDEIVGVVTTRAARLPGDPIADANVFSAFVRAARAGDVVTLTLRRAGKQREVRATVAAR
jgi:S1-C subfamily serine protease